MTIGIIEDDSLLNQALEIALQNAGYYTISAHTRKEALDLLREKVDVFLIDIGLPDGNGIELYQELQMEKRIPAIFLTARDEEKEMLLAFDAGAQDYVVKPFSMKVLMKRLEVVLKRNPEERYMVGELTLYPDRKQVFTGKTEISLTAKEYQLLEYLMRNQGQVLTKENILETIWGVESLWDAGIAVVASAGNDGPERGSIASPGDSRKIITVGAYEEIRRGRTRMGQRWKYSGRGPSDTCIVKPDLVAPGLGIISCGRIDKEKKAYVEKSGTSMAAPIVSGAVACLLSEYPDMTNVEVKLKLRESCISLDEEGTGWGLLNIGELL